MILLQIAESPVDKFQEWRAKVLLALDESEFATSERLSHQEISERLGISKSSVYRTGKRFVELGLEATLNAKISGKAVSTDEELILRRLISEARLSSNWHSARSLAKKLGRSHPTISKVLRRLSLDL